ncbi:MAG: hypothetical protein RLZZ350_1114 [Verrucomicrobiota bacterium]
MIAADPWQGGATWAVLQYLLGLRRLGHEVFFVEPVAAKTLRPAGAALAGSENARYFQSVCDSYDLCDSSALLLADTRETFGLSYAALQRIATRADLLLNISGLLADENLFSKIPIRAYLDLDPAFNQLWQAVQQIDMRFTGHTHHVTIGQNIGVQELKTQNLKLKTESPVPTCGLNWLKTFQPVVLEYWPIMHEIKHDALTTIANWRGYGSIDFNGVSYGQKVHSLRQFISLPTLTPEKFSLALAIHADEKKDLAALKQNNWQLLDPARVAHTPASYRDFIQTSKAEFGVAKSGYVHSRCGWFSDRSVCYLASGRPVIAQDCGFKHLLPCDEGLLAFDTSEDVLRAIDSLNSDYARHAKRAREIAVEFFDSDKVLKRLLGLVAC